MFAIVVLLTKPNQHCIVPEEYIFGLKEFEAELKTWGAKKDHKHLIYWHRHLLNDNSGPDSIFHPPNFNEAKCEQYPPPSHVDSACFYGLVKCFKKTLEEAKEYCNRLRPVKPVVYNKANSKNQPAPPNVSPSGEQQSEGSDEEDKFMLPTVDMDPSDAMALDDIVADDSTDNFTNNQNENVAEPTESNELTEQDESENELNLETSQTSEPATENYTVAIDTVRHSNSLLQPYIPAGNENVDLNENGQTLITRVFDDEMEMTYIYGQKLCAKKNDPYRTKENDVLSGNLPFQENREKDRAYLVKSKDGHKEVKLKGRIVDWLIRINTERKEIGADKTFIKVLLITIFTVKLIKSNVELEEGILDFIKDLFLHRAHDDSSRHSNFENLVSIASEEIRNSM